MLEAYWRKFVDMKIAEEYFFLYIHHSQHRIWGINAVCMIISCTGIVAWLSDYFPPILSSAIILVAQILSVLQPLYPYSNRRYAASCIYGEYKRQNLFSEQTLNKYLFGTLEESALSDALEKLETNTADIEDRFCAPETFHPNKRLHKIAQQNVMQYLTVHFNLGG